MRQQILLVSPDSSERAAGACELRRGNSLAWWLLWLGEKRGKGEEE
jgi:hypothetical protein